MVKEDDAKVRVGSTERKANLAKDELKDNVVFHVILLALAQVEKMNFKIEDSKFHEQNKI